MAKCNLNIPFDEPIEGLIEKARKGIISIGGTFEGDTKKGNFSIPTKLGKIIGNYSVGNNSIAFEITDKPSLVTCNKIESELKKYLNSSSQSSFSFD